jgi:DNA-binding Lrp family transcriptional regulator
MKALCLVRFAGRPPEKVLGELKEIKGVQDAFLTFGRFDAVIVLTADIEGAKRIVRAIQSNPGVKKTETRILPELGCALEV